MSDLQVRLVVSQDGTGKVSAEIEGLNDQVIDMGNQSQVASDKTVGAFDRIFNSARQSQRAAKRLAAGVLSVAAVVTAGVVNLGNYQEGLVGVAKTTDLTEAQVDSVGNRLDELARKDIPLTVGSLLDLGESAGQLGVDGVQNLEKFSDTVGRLDFATDLGGPEAAATLTRILNITQEGVSDVDRLASSIVSLGNSYAATESQIARNAIEVARATAAYGVSSAEAAAYGATLASLGVQAELGGSVIGRVIREIDSIVRNGGDELQRFADIVGLTADEVVQQFGENAPGVFQLFVQGLGGIVERGGSATAVLESLGLSGDEINKTLPVLATRYDLLSSAVAQSNREFQSNTALVNETERAFDTLQAKSRLLGSAVASATRDVASAFGDGIKDNIDALRGSINDLIDDGTFERIGEIISNTLGVAVPLVENLAVAYIASLTPALVSNTIAMVAKNAAITRLVAASKVLRTSTLLLAGAQAGFNVALRAVSNPAVLAAAAGVLLYNAYIDYADALEQARAISDETAISIQAVNQASADGFEPSDLNEYQTALRLINSELEQVDSQLNQIQSRRVSQSLSGQVTGGPNGQQRALLERRNELEQRSAVIQEQVRFGLALSGQEQNEYNQLIDAYNSIAPRAIELLQRYGIGAQAASQANGEVAVSIQEQLDSLDAQIEKQREQLILQRDQEIGLLNYQQAQAIANLAAAEGTEQFEVDRAAIIDKFDALRSLAAQLDAVKKANEAEEQSSRASDEANRISAEVVQNASTVLAQYGTHQQRVDQIESQRIAKINQLKSEQSALTDAGIDLIDVTAAVNAEYDAQIKALDETNKSYQTLSEDLSAAIKAYADGEDALDEYNKQQFILSEVAKLGEDATEAQIQKITELAGKLFDASNATRQLRSDFELAADAAISIGDAIKGLAGSEREFKILEVAVSSLALAQGIAAIVNQGTGDPYSAFARIAAMTAIVAPLLGQLGQSIASLGSSGFNDVAAQRQQTQGTGSVLGDAAADSASIKNSIEITADASQELVGINRGMLRSLQEINQGIGAASGLLARGAGDVGFSQINPGGFFSVQASIENAILDNANFLGSTGELLSGSFILKGITKLLGGKTEVVDQGIELVGGTIADIIQGGAFRAFQTVESKKFFFSSTKTTEQFGDIDPRLQNQFGLIVESIVDTVREAATAIGLPLDIISQRIAQFEVEAQKISLKDLTAEEQQAELEAVFSRLFDDLAADVVPFVEQFQKVGEGIGQTLVRVATGVLVTEEAIARLGFIAANETPEQFAQLSQALIEASGGLDQFINDFTNFFDKFASDEIKFAAAQSDISRAFKEVGLEVPPTRDALFDLVSTLDAGTEAGRQQISAILALADTADSYYSYIDQQEREREQQEAERLQREQELSLLLSDVRSGITGLADAASPLTEQLLQIRDAYGQNISRAAELGATEQQLGEIRFREQQQIAALIADLRSSLASTAEQIINGSALNTGLNAASSNLFDAGDQLANAAGRLTGTADSLRNTIRNIIAGGNSNLDPIGSRNQLQADFDAAIAAGDFETANNIAPQLVQLIRDVGASSSSADAQVQAILDALAAGADVLDAARPPTRGQVGSIAGGVDRLVSNSEQIAAQAFEQAQLAARFVEEIGILTQLTGENGLSIVDELSLPLERLTELLGVDLISLTADQSIIIANLAESLNVNIQTLGDRLNVSLGSLADATSLLNDGFELALAGLPPEVVAPLVEALGRAESTGDVSELERLTNDLPLEYRNALAPFFDSIDISTEAAETVTKLDEIKQVIDTTHDDLVSIESVISSLGGEQISVLESIRANLSEANSFVGIPAYGRGGLITEPRILAAEAGAEYMLDARETRAAYKDGLYISPLPTPAFANSGRRSSAASDEPSESLMVLKQIEGHLNDAKIQGQQFNPSMLKALNSIVTGIGDGKDERQRRHDIDTRSRGTVSCGGI